ncbi:UNVERIFIED_CONTAM: hypothetical protein PYX00_009357 [Menopon gallinae]|uniref:Uncharacterized protein n=1 Tax=Menopon gallinae TaxID=328185 RepID=A0AAW2HB66_9NEOP
MKSEKWCCAATGIGGVLFIIGLSVALYSSQFTSNLYHEQMQLKESSTAYNLWIHTPIPLYFEAYLFNWTNAKEFMKNKSVVPHFEEVGPFVFKEVHDRVNLTWNDNKTLAYNQVRKWEFVPEKSVNLSVKVTNLNVIAATIARFLKVFPKRLKPIINFELNLLEDFVVTSPANNWLFEGMDDRLLTYLSIIAKILHLQKNPFPERFGWFYKRNMSATYDGRFLVETGADDIYNVGIMDRWNGVAKTKYYDGECGMVNGTSGELFPPMKTAEDDIDIFVSDICSSIKLYRTGSSEVKGIKSYTYTGDKGTLDNGQLFSRNKCFCGEECAPTGARDASRCRVAPLLFSFPHFYLADDSYRKSISGMNPNKTEHEFFIELDPVTGIPTNIKAQFQVNTLIEPISWLSMFKDLPKLYIPMFWFRERATITTDLAFKVLLIQKMPSIISGLCYGLAALGLILAFVAAFMFYRKRNKSTNEELLIPAGTDVGE